MYLSNLILLYNRDSVCLVLTKLRKNNLADLYEMLHPGVTRAYCRLDFSPFQDGGRHYQKYL